MATKHVTHKKPGKKWSLWKKNYATYRLAKNDGDKQYDTIHKFYLIYEHSRGYDLYTLK